MTREGRTQRPQKTTDPQAPTHWFHLDFDSG